MQTVNDIREKFKQLLANEQFIEDKSGVRLIEIDGANFIADQDAIFGTPNKDYIEREIAWYDNQSLYVKDIPGGAPEIWKQVSSSQGKINSNYGWCIYSKDNKSQYDAVLNELKRQSSSRRAIMIYTRPSMQTDFNTDGMSDFMCTNTVQYMVRNGQLNAYVNMRSNDAVFGYKNDIAWQKTVLNRLSKDLDIPVGHVNWFATSLHVYERHWKLIE